MNTQEFKRKLTAVFSADVVGYSRLMGEDEVATVKTLESYKQIMFSLIKQHRGRVIDSPGDNLLAEFASVVDGVQCAVAVQNEFKARNADLPENRRMQFRIGINLGDVIEEGGRIYGDGVNIAARLEALADPGGICVSKTAFDHIETKLPLGYEYLGEKEVKNITKPVGAYKVVMEPRVTVVGTVKKETPLRKLRLLKALAVILILLLGTLALRQFLLKPSPPSAEKADSKKIESQLLAQLEAQKKATEQAQRATEEAKREADLLAQKMTAEEASRRAREERIRLDQERKQLETERRVAAAAKKQAMEEASRNRHDQEQKRLESEKRAAEVAKHDGTYSGQLCNQWTKPPFSWPVILVVRNGIAEASWISPAGKTARARGTIAADGSVQLNLSSWTPSGIPVEATLLGRISDGEITASGEWGAGGKVAYRVVGDWKRASVTAAAPAVTRSHDGTYSGQLCNQWTNPPFCWPVPLVVRGGMAEGSWISNTKETATARGTVADDGTVQLNLSTWTWRGTPTEATLIGRIGDGAITASGQWSTGGGIAGDWKRTP
jgi:class 3 adenylate cyclase